MMSLQESILALYAANGTDLTDVLRADLHHFERFDAATVAFMKHEMGCLPLCWKPEQCVDNIDKMLLVRQCVAAHEDNESTQFPFGPPTCNFTAWLDTQGFAEVHVLLEKDGTASIMIVY
jgi:uncharacterized cysteine cluster protein YcgN (CxxCxxCC family)